MGPQLQPAPLLQGLGRWAEAVGEASQATRVGAGEEAELLPWFHRFLSHGREGGFPPSSRSGCQINAQRATSTHVYFHLFSPKGGNVGYSLFPFTALPGAHPFLPLGERTRGLFQHYPFLSSWQASGLPFRSNAIRGTEPLLQVPPIKAAGCGCKRSVACLGPLGPHRGRACGHTALLPGASQSRISRPQGTRARRSATTCRSRWRRSLYAGLCRTGSLLPCSKHLPAGLARHPVIPSARPRPGGASAGGWLRREPCPGQACVWGAKKSIQIHTWSRGLVFRPAGRGISGQKRKSRQGQGCDIPPGLSPGLPPAGRIFYQKLKWFEGPPGAQAPGRPWSPDTPTLPS